MKPAPSPFVRFYFDAPPGSYDVLLGSTGTGKGANQNMTCGRNGPLIVLPNRSRSLFVGGAGIYDWHSVAAIAGSVPSAVDVQVLVYRHPKHCGDQVHLYDEKTANEIAPPQVVNAENDEGAYYANFHAYGRQDYTVALQFRGALFTHGAVLLTNTPATEANKPPFIVKDITPTVLQAAVNDNGQDRLVCVSGF
jgi:hypothetical protein